MTHGAVTARRPLSGVATTRWLGRCGYASGPDTVALITAVGNSTGWLSDLRVNSVIDRAQTVASGRHLRCAPLCR
jgi:hypothetical protein